MSKLPAFQFYPGDWRKDPGVQALPFHDRGVWFEILCLMHESSERGRLVLNGKPMPDTALARLLGLDDEALSETLNRLTEFGVATRDEQGALVNRRMVRDERIRLVRVASGSQGGNPRLTGKYNKPGFVYVIGTRDDGAVKIGVSTNPTNRLYKLRHESKISSLEVMAFLAVEDMGKKEEELHGRYAKWSVGGEWFRFPQEMLANLVFLMEGRNQTAKQKTTPSTSSSTSSSDVNSSGVCGEVAKRDSPPAKPPHTAEVSIMVFPCVGRGPAEWSLTESKLAEYRDSFPGVDVLSECRKARQWCIDNPTRRKTAAGMPKFLTGWLSRVQNDGRRGHDAFDQGQRPGGGRAADPSRIHGDEDASPSAPAPPASGNGQHGAAGDADPACPF